MKAKFQLYQPIQLQLRIKKNISLIVFCFLCFHVFGQEKLTPLHGNKQLIDEQNESTNERSSIYPDKIFYQLDTLSLPIVDDFSSNKFQPYYYYSFPSSNVSTVSIYNFTLVQTINPFSISNPANLLYSKTRQFDSTFIESTNTWQRVVTDSFNIEFRNFFTDNNVVKSYPQNPLLPDSTFKIWIGASKDTLFTNGTFSIKYPTIDANVKSISQLVTTFELVKVANSGLNGVWMDFKKTVFINNTFPKNQPTIGVATFDGLNENGMPYDFTGTISGRADYLTSKPINLNFSSARYLSFLWQRGGLGDTPEFTDSLILQFRTPLANWQTMWSKTGNVTDENFTQQTIIIDSIFLKNGFQFRFINRANLGGANDHWNIDYVRLVANANDTIINDLAFISTPTTFLKNYQSVPYNQYTSGLMADSTKNFINNLSSSNLGQNTNFSYRVTDFYGQNQIDAINIFNFNFAANEVNNCNFCASALNPLLVTANHPNLIYPSMNSCSEFKIKQWISPLNLNSMRENDTIQFIQRFSDYFAYDDGSAEAGYLLTTPVASMAAQFDLSIDDNMLGMRIFFDPINEDFSDIQFYIRIWNDTTVLLNGSPFSRPGKILYEFGPFKPRYTNENNQSSFAEYLFDANANIPAGKFYAGIYKESNIGLNVGFDRNNNNQTRMFFTPVAGTWGNTQFDGTYMMRPVFSSCPNGVPSTISQINTDEIKLFPNPANDILNIQTSFTEFYSIDILDVSGNLIYTNTNLSNNAQIDVSNLSNGMYFVKIKNNNLVLKTEKFCIVK